MYLRLSKGNREFLFILSPFIFVYNREQKFVKFGGHVLMQKIFYSKIYGFFDK